MRIKTITPNCPRYKIARLKLQSEFYYNANIAQNISKMR